MTLLKLLSRIKGVSSAINPALFRTVLTDVLDIPTYDAAPSETHFNWTYFETAWNGYKYWGVFTPYPFEDRENPSIVVSNDGETWIEPPGISNPIDLLNTGDPYNSDPCIVYVENEDLLYVFYRTTYGATNTQEVNYRTSADGITWSAKTTLQTGPFGEAGSFSIVNKNGQWFMWYVDTRGGNDADYEVYVRRALTIADLWDNPQSITECTFSFIPSGYHLWQFNIILNTNQQFIGVMIFTLKQVGAPNQQGKAHVMTSLNGITWSVSEETLQYPNDQQQYLVSLRRTEKAQTNGAQFELMQSVLASPWVIRNSLLWMADTSIAGDYDAVSNMECVVSPIVRLSYWKGCPVLRVRRSSDNEEVDVFENNTLVGELQLADGTLLETWLGVDTCYVERGYNQTGKVDYLFGSNQPTLIKNLWNGYAGWGMVFSGTNQVLESYVDDVQDFQGFTAACLVESGRMWTVKSGSNYFGIVTGSNIGLLNGTNITAQNLPKPCVYSAWHGGSGAARIRRDSVQIANGSTSVPSVNEKAAIGAQWATSAYSNFLTGKIAEIVMWNAIPASIDYELVENQQASDFPFVPVVQLEDTYTDVNGTLIAAHTPDINLFAGVYASNGGTWQIQNNKLTLASPSGTPTCTIDCGLSDCIVEGTIDPGGSGGSGLVFRHVDINNFIYIRLFGGTTLGVFKYVAGVFSTVNTWAVAAPGEPFTLKVELIGTIIRAFLNGTLVGSTTVAEHTTATRVGWVTNTAEGATTTFENLKVSKWN